MIDIGGKDLDLQPLVDLFQDFAAQHGQRIGFLAGGTGRDPKSNFPVRDPLEQRRQVLGFQGFEHFPIPEEAGHPDQQFPIEGHRLPGVVLHEADVLTQIVNLVHRHAPLDAPDHRAGFVEGEIHPGTLPQQGENSGQIVLVEQQGLRAIRLGRIGMAGEGQQLLGHFLGRQGEIRQPGGNRGARHAIELGRLLALHHHHPAGSLDRPDAAHAVAAGTREDHADRLFRLIVGQRAQEHVDG